MTRDAAWREDAPHAPLCDSRWCQASYGDESCHAFDVACIDLPRRKVTAHQRDLALTWAALVLTLLAVTGAYAVGQAAQDRRCGDGVCEPVALGRSWT